MLMYRIFSVILIDLNGPIKQNKVNKTGEKGRKYLIFYLLFIQLYFYVLTLNRGQFTSNHELLSLMVFYIIRLVTTMFREDIELL